MQKLKRKIVIIRNQSSEIVVIRTILNDIQKYTMKKKAKKRAEIGEFSGWLKFIYFICTREKNETTI